jgi:S-DNA-T family DNA segregation ATPase FtsK/SpoIIIE
MKKEFINWKNDEIKIAANLCIDYAYELDGAEVLKAINPRDEAIKDYLAFYLSTKIEQQSIDPNKYYYRKLLSLDLYDQLFEDDETIGYLQTRPDFLLIEVAKKDNSLEDLSDLKVKVRIIECKMGGSSYMNTAINKAKEQVSVGNSRLLDIWVNHNGVKRRYWQNQLYKILTLQNSIKMNSEELDKYAKKVMHIFTGKYSTEFENCIYTFSLENENDFTVNHFYKGIPIKQLNFGTITTKNVLLGREKESVYDFGDMEYNSFVAENSNIKELEEENNVGVRQESISNAVKDNIFEDQISASIENSFKDNEVSSIEVTETEVNKKYSRLIEHENMIDIFKAYNIICSDEEKKSIQQKLDRLAQELKQRKTKVIVQKYLFGPDIIRVVLDLATGVNISQLKKFDDDMKYWLSINEKPFIYIKDGKIVMDIIRDNRQTIGLKNMLTEINKRDLLNDSSKKFYALLGSDILGNPLLIDFSDSNTPHLLVAGQTGSGKSVLLNSMLLSIMMFYSPSEVEMILVDPKFIELTSFTESPYTKEVLTEAEDAVIALENLVEEMNNRYKTFRAQKSKNISSYNAKVDSNKMKRILMVFDEYAALMEENKEIAKRLEHAIKILSQKARAAGIHLIICTQSPRADIITTTIRNNLTARVGLRVADSVASNLILDTSGAETLLGKGDMLLKTASSSNFLRAKSPYVTEDEIEAFIEACKEVY